MLQTRYAELEVDDRGPRGGRAVVLLHGFPDGPSTWDTVAELLPTDLRVVRPALRGVGRSRAAPGAESGQVAALAADVLGLLEQLDLREVVLVGHDWGARAADGAAALDPSRLGGLVTLATAYGPRTGLAPQESLDDAEMAWYRWWLCTAAGAAAFRTDPLPLIERAWRVWSPRLEIDGAERAALLGAFQNEQFVETVVHYYRHGAGEAAGVASYGALQSALDDQPSIPVPTTFLVGTEDGCETLPPARAAAPWFSAGYDVRILDGVGHFVQREAPHAVASAILQRLGA